MHFVIFKISSIDWDSLTAYSTVRAYLSNHLRVRSMTMYVETDIPGP